MDQWEGLFMKKSEAIWVNTLLFCLAVFSLLIPADTMGADEKATLSKKVTDSRTLEYLIGPEDILEISVWKNAELSKVVVVRPDGKISLPLIGDVLAAGYTPEQLRNAIVEKLKEYQETVVVSVIVQNVLSYNIFILGEVKKPGVYTMKRKTTLLQAIALSGGFNQFASKNKIMVIRESRDGGAGDEKIKVRFDDIIKKGRSDMNLVLKPGDTIFVP